jgi:hypothetical protein
MKATLTLSAALLFVTSTFYSGCFGGLAPEQFAIPQTDSPIVLLGWAFAIWGLIYAWLVVHAGFDLLKHDVDAAWDKVRWPLTISLTVGASWIPVAKSSPLWAKILLWIMLLTTLAALVRGTASKDRQRLQAPRAICSDWLVVSSFVSKELLCAGYGVVTNQVGCASTTNQFVSRIVKARLAHHGI